MQTEPTTPIDLTPNEPLLPSDIKKSSLDVSLDLDPVRSISKSIPISMGDLNEISGFALAGNFIKGAIPCMIQFLSTMFINNATIHYTSLKNDIVLYNGVSLALNIISCFSFYLIFHSNIGFNAATSQALGAKNKTLVGLYLHKAFLLHIMVNIVTYFVLLAAPFVFHWAGLDENVTNTAFNYILFIPLYILGVIIFDTLKNFLYAHKIFFPLVIIQLIIAVSYWFMLDYLFITLDMGLKGIALSLTVCQGLGVGILIGYLCIAKPSELKESWVRPQKESFTAIWPLAKVMASVGAMGYIEVLAYRVESFASAAFSSQQFAALTAFLAFGDLFYVLPVGISFPTVTYVGNATGCGDRKGAMRIIRYALAISTAILGILLIIYYFTRKYLFEFYSQDIDVLEIMNTMGYLYFITFPADFYQTILAGIIKGFAREKAGTKMFLISLYCVGLPLSLIFSFVLKYYSPGMWLGNGIGIYFSMFFFMWVIYKTDFKTQFTYIRQRITD